MTIPDRVEAIIQEIGQSGTYTTFTDVFDVATGTNVKTPTDQVIQMAVRAYTGQEMAGQSSIQQGDREFRISAQELTADPSNTDEITIGSEKFTVQEVNTRLVRGVPAIHIIRATGGGG